MAASKISESGLSAERDESVGGRARRGRASAVVSDRVAAVRAVAGCRGSGARVRSGPMKKPKLVVWGGKRMD